MMFNQIESLYFTWIDYSLFSLVLLVSVLIGIYFGFFGKKQDNRQEYIHGGRSMKVLPIAASLIATDITGITLLAVPADIYMNGSAFWLCVISGIITSFAIAFVYLPVFYKLKLNSSFEYLKLRFDNRVCVVASATFLMTVVAFMPIIIYIPALAFSQVSGVNLNYVIPIVCIICIFYTTIGGIKAVVWTDTVQMFIMLGSLLTVVGLGVYVEGGFANIWKINERGGRIDFNLDPDPTSRTSGLAVIIGLTAIYSGYGNNPVHIQRFLAVPTYKDALKTILIFCIGSNLFKSFSIYVGLIMYARYANCDPISAGLVQKADQLLPYYVMDVSSSIPGLPGLFIAGIFCAALSTMSSGLNTLSGTIYEDFIADKMPKDISEKRISNIMKIISVVLGLVCMLFVFLVQFMGGLFQLTLKVTALAGGPILAIFTLGMLTPFVNTKGILWGILGGVCTVAFLLFGAIYYELIGKLKPVFKPLVIDQCPANITMSPYIPTIAPDAELPFYPFRITFYYYTVIGALVTAIIAVIYSLIIGNDELVDKDLLSPVIYPFISDKYKSGRAEIEKQEQNELKSIFNREEKINIEELQIYNKNNNINLNVNKIVSDNVNGNVVVNGNVNVSSDTEDVSNSNNEKVSEATDVSYNVSETQSDSVKKNSSNVEST